LVIPPILTHERQPQLDPGIIVHPPPSSLGAQPKGTLLAQNLYPGLVLLPIDMSKLKGQPIPIAWQDLKVQRIPAAPAKIAAALVQSGATTR
jgi:hypothetical protein